MWRCLAAPKLSRLSSPFYAPKFQYEPRNCIKRHFGSSCSLSPRNILNSTFTHTEPDPSHSDPNCIKSSTNHLLHTPHTNKSVKYPTGINNYSVNNYSVNNYSVNFTLVQHTSVLGFRFKTQTRVCLPISVSFNQRYYSNNHNDNNNTNNTNNKNTQIKMIWDPRSLFTHFRKLFSFFKKGKRLTADQMFAIFSWAVFGTTFWVVVGTTTLLSAVLWIVNTLRFQEWVALRVGAYLTRQSGVHISFESAVGNWKQGTITVQNVILAREGLTQTGQSAIYLTIDRMDVELNLLWMLEGKGILKACKASGVRGHVDRRPEIVYNANNPNATPAKRTWRRGDLEMENLSVSDLLIQLYLPEPNSRPLPVSIYTLECDQFRFHWLFLDLLSAKSVVGKFDGCLFTFGIPQQVDIIRTVGGKQPVRERELKINGIPMSLLSKTATGPLGWIKEGTLDISLNITLPKLESTTKHKEMNLDHPTNKPAHHKDVEIVETEEETTTNPERSSDGTALVMRFDVMFNHLHASAPFYTPELSYLNNAVVHPILAYINSHNKHIPLSFEFQLDVAGLAGARSPGEAGMWDALSASVAEAFGRIVHDSQNTETLRSVANTLLKDCWSWLSGWVYSPSYAPA